MNLFNGANKLNQKSVEVKYDYFDYPYLILTGKQLKDAELWSILTRQFFIRNDIIDGGWRGEYWGKLMRGASLVYAYNKDKELYRILENTVKDLLKLVDEKGRISSYTLEKEFTGWDVWSRKYVMLGLEYFYEICANKRLKKKIVNILRLGADYIMDKVGSGEGQISINQTSNAHGCLNSVSIIQPFVKLYKLTRNNKYLDYVKGIIKNQDIDGQNIFALAFEDKKAPFEYPVTKAYEMTSCFEGLLDFYEETLNKDCLKACVNFADKILQTDFTVVGGTGCDGELLDNSTKTQVILSEINKHETCVTVTLMKYFIALYKYTDDVKYIHAVEKSYLNLYLGTLREGKFWGSVEQPIFYSYSPVFNNPRWNRMGGGRCISTYARFGCCIAIGAAGAGLLPNVGAMANGESLTLNFLYGGKYSLKDCGLEFIITSDYPKDGLVKIKFNKVGEKGISLRCRKPEWCDDFKVNLNGDIAESTVQDGYVYFNRISAGDELTVELDMPIKVLHSNSVNPKVDNLFALQKGPIMLCADSEEVDLSLNYKIKVDGTGNAILNSFDGEKYLIQLEDGNVLPMREYKNTGRAYPIERNISVWLYK